MQKLDLLSKVVEYEVKRQSELIKIREELKSRNADDKDLKEDFVDVSDIFKNTGCKVLKGSISKQSVILAGVLKKFAGLLGVELGPSLRFGTELAHRAIFWGKVGGIFHTDELPQYGITQEEVNALKKRMKASESDAVVLVADKYESALEALKAVVERAKEALSGVPKETRGANPDGTTRYMRPRPGSARMYPETDVPPTILTPDRISSLSKQLPQLPGKIIERLIKKYNINKKLATQLIDSYYLDLFEDLILKTELQPSFIATVLTENIKSLEREGVPIDNLSESQIFEVFNVVNKGLTAKESIVEILKWLSKNSNSSARNAIKILGLGMLSSDELRQKIKKVVEREAELIANQPRIAFNKLLGKIMGEVRGKADAKSVTRILKEEIKTR